MFNMFAPSHPYTLTHTNTVAESTQKNYDWPAEVLAEHKGNGQMSSGRR